VQTKGRCDAAWGKQTRAAPEPIETCCARPIRLKLRGVS